MNNEIQVVSFDETAMSPEVIQNQVNVIQRVMKQVMQDGEHYGKIPGCGDKPTLLKPGAEKLSMTFRLAPSYQITKTELTGGHREYEILCTLKHIPTGQVVGEGVGLCSSMESKYRWRQADRKCPKCGKAAIIKGAEQYGGGWLCWKKKDGCGTKFLDGDKSIEGQEAGRVENPDIADTFNTVLKICKKRAHVDAVLTATAASDLFTQDIEDIAPVEREALSKKPPTEPVGRPVSSTTTKSAPPKHNPISEEPPLPPEPPPPPPPPPPPQPKQETQQGSKPTIPAIRKMFTEGLFSDGFTTDPLFVPFLIAKRWLTVGQTINDLTDNQVERLYNNYNQLETLFNEYKEVANA